MGRADSPLKERMVFSFGVQRSGTYWLQRIVGAHPDVSEIPSETQLFDRGIDRLFEVFHHGSRGSPTAGEMYVERDVLLDATRDLCDSVLAPYLDSGARYLAERTATHVYSVATIAGVYPDARLIHIIRDGRDVARSMVRQGWGPSSVGEAAERWRSGVVGARAAAPAGRCLEVRYEALLSDPEAEIARLYEWLDLAVTPERMEAALSEARLGRNEDPNDPRLAAGKWRDSFSAQDLADFMEVSGDLLAELGYETAAVPAGRRLRVRGLVRRLRPADRAQAVPSPGLDLAGAQRLVDGVLEAMHVGAPERLAGLVAADFRARVVSREGEQRLDGVDAFAAWVDQDPAASGTQLRADPHPGLPTYSVVQSLRQQDGRVEDRVLEFVIRGDRLEVLVIYRFPLG